MLITRTILYLATHLLFLLIGYLLAKDFRHYQNYKLPLMKQKDSRHPEVTPTCFVLPSCEQGKKKYQERKLREICFYFCTANDVTFVFTSICSNHSKSSHESDRHFFLPYSIREKDDFKDCEAFLFFYEREPVTFNLFKNDFSRLRTVVSHQVPLPLITSRDDFSRMFLRELYRPEKLPVEDKFSVLQKYRRATNCIFFSLSNFKILSRFIELYDCVCLRERIEKSGLINPFCKYKSASDMNDLLPFLLKIESSRRNVKHFFKCENIMTNCKYFKELNIFLEHNLSCEEESTKSSKIKTNNPTISIEINEKIRDSKSKFKKYFDNLSHSEKKIANFLNVCITIRCKFKLIHRKDILSNHINIKEACSKTHAEGENPLFFKYSPSYSPERKSRKNLKYNNQELFKKLIHIGKTRYRRKILENSAGSDANTPTLEVSKVLKKTPTSGVNFLKKLKNKNSLLGFQRISSFNNTHEKVTRFKKSLFALRPNNISQKDSTSNKKAILQERKSNYNSKQRSFIQSPLFQNSENPIRIDFSMQLNKTGVDNLKAFPKDILDVTADKTDKPDVDLATEKNIYFPPQDENSSKHETSSKNQPDLRQNSEITSSFPDTENSLVDDFLRTLDKAKEFPRTSEQQDISSTRENVGHAEFNDDTFVGSTLTQNEFSDIDNIVKNEIASTKISNVPNVEHGEIFSVGKEISAETVKDFVNKIPGLTLPTKESINTAVDISTASSPQNVGLKTGDPFVLPELNTNDDPGNFFQYALGAEHPKITRSEVKTEPDATLPDKPTSEDNSMLTEMQGKFFSEESVDLIPADGVDNGGSLELEFSKEGDGISFAKTGNENSVTYNDFYSTQLFTTVPSLLMSTTSTIENKLNERRYVSSKLDEITISSEGEGETNDYFNRESFIPTKDFSAVSRTTEDENKYFHMSETTSEINGGWDSPRIDSLFTVNSFSTDQLEISNEVSSEKIITIPATETLSATEPDEPFSLSKHPKESYITDNDEQIYFSTSARSMSFDEDEFPMPSKDETYPVTSPIGLKEIESILTESSSNVSSIASPETENLTNEIPVTNNDVKLDTLSTTEYIKVNSVKGVTSIYPVDETFSSSEDSLTVFSENIAHPLNNEITTDSKISTNSDEAILAKTISNSLNNADADNSQVLSSGDVTVLTTSDEEDLWEQYDVSEITEPLFSLSSERDLSVTVQESLTDGTSKTRDTGLLSSSDTVTARLSTMMSEFSTNRIATTSEYAIPSYSDSIFPLQTENLDMPFDEASNSERVLPSSTDHTISIGDIGETRTKMLPKGTETEVPLSSEKDTPTQFEIPSRGATTEIPFSIGKGVLTESEILSKDVENEVALTSAKDVSTEFERGVETEVPLLNGKDLASQADEITDITKEETLIRTDRDVLAGAEEDSYIPFDETSEPLENEIKTTSERGLFSSADYGALIPDFEADSSRGDDALKMSTEKGFHLSSDDALTVPKEKGTVSFVSENYEITKTTLEKGLFSSGDNGLLTSDNQEIVSSSTENELIRTSSENGLISSSGYSLVTPDETETETEALASENDGGWISSESEIFTSSENDILSQEDKTTYSVKEVIRTERQVLPSSEDPAPGGNIATESEEVDRKTILPVVIDMSTDINYPELPNESEPESGISDISSDLSNIEVTSDISDIPSGLSSEDGISDMSAIPSGLSSVDGISDMSDIPSGLSDIDVTSDIPDLPSGLLNIDDTNDMSDIPSDLSSVDGTSYMSDMPSGLSNVDSTNDMSFEAEAGVDVNVNKDISTEFNLKTSLQNTPPNGNFEGSTELNTIEKTSVGGDVIDTSMEKLPDAEDSSTDPVVLSTPSNPISSIKPETEETPLTTIRKEINVFSQVHLSTTAPESTYETDYDSETISEDVKTNIIRTTPETSSTTFEKSSSSEQTPEQTSTTEKNVPSTTSSTSLTTSATEKFSSTTIMTSLRTGTNDIISSSSTSSSSFKPSTTISSTKVTSSTPVQVASSTVNADETTLPTDMTPIPFRFTIDADYDEVVGTRKKEFEESLTNQLVVAMRIPFECLQNLEVSKGSVNVNFDLVSSSNHGHLADEKALKAAADELKRMIDNGQLNINDLDGNTLVVVPMDPPTKAPVVNQSESTTLILGVVIGAFILTVIAVAITAIIIKRKNNGGHRLTPIEEMRSKLPSYREIPFQEELFVKGSNKLMLGKYCYNTGQWVGPGPEPVLYQAPDSAVYRPPTDSEILQTPRPPTVVLDSSSRNFIRDHGPWFGHHQVEQSCAATRSRFKRRERKAEK